MYMCMSGPSLLGQIGWLQFTAFIRIEATATVNFRPACDIVSKELNSNAKDWFVRAILKIVCCHTPILLK